MADKPPSAVPAMPAIAAPSMGAVSDITLQTVFDRLEAMRERTPLGRTNWQPPSVKMLLEGG